MSSDQPLAGAPAREHPGWPPLDHPADAALLAASTGRRRHAPLMRETRDRTRRSSFGAEMPTRGPVQRRRATPETPNIRPRWSDPEWTSVAVDTTRPMAASTDDEKPKRG